MTSTVTPLRRLAKRLHPHLRGWLAEKLALTYYMGHGWLPVKNIRQYMAQTDLTLVHGTTILLVEVKYRAEQGRGHVAVKPEQVERLKRQMLVIAGQYPGYTVALEVFLVFPHKPFWQRIRNPYNA